MTDAIIIQVLIALLISVLGFFGVTISKKLDTLQAQFHGLAITHGERLTSLETKIEIINQRTAFINGQGQN